jgi:hypothetical protein
MESSGKSTVHNCRSGNVQIILGSIIGLPLKGTAWIVAALDEVPLFVFNGDLMWCEYETLILPDKMCGQTFLVKSRLDLNIFQYIRSSLDILNPAGDGQMCLQ